MPKTIRNEYYKKLSYEKLMQAHLESRKGKSTRKEIIQFNLKQEEYIMWLYEQLKNRTYRHSGYTSFYVTEPKLRRIEKSIYIDRIVHRWYVDNFMQEHFVKSFSYSSFACLKGNGMHNACLYVQEMMKHCKRIWNNYYVIKMDVAKYFQNIDKQILYEILYSNGIDKGLPIGNYTSQCFANIYLNELDQYMKHKLKLNFIRTFLKEKLCLELNRKTQIFKSIQGVNFCGYKINEYRLKIRDKGKRKLKKKVKLLEKQVKQGNITSKEAHKYLSGHLGYINVASTKNLENKLFATDA